MNAIGEQFSAILWNIFNRPKLIDLIDVALLSFIIYQFLVNMRHTRVSQTIKGVVVLIAATWLSDLIGMRTIHALLSWALNAGPVLLIVLFQPEIRRILEELGTSAVLLDPAGRREVMKTILELNRVHGITIVLITHYMDEAAQCDRVVVMDSGSVLLDSTPKDVFSHVKMLKTVGLDVPQATEICYEINKAGFTMPTEVLTVKECADELQKLIERTYAAKRKAAKLGK